jgi:hypothetical protein
MGKKIRNILPIIAVSLIPTILIWLPYFLRIGNFWGIPLPKDGMATIVANYDGPLFIVVAKTLYSPELVGNFSFTLPSIYYAAHFPLFPLLMRSVASLTGYPYAMLSITLLSSVLAIYFFSIFISKYVEKKDLLWITLVFAIFPARWLIVRSVGSSEPLFIASTIASIYYFKNKRYWKAGVWGMLAQLTKSAGILLFLAYTAAIIYPKFKKAATTTFSRWFHSLKLSMFLPIFLIPLALIGLFVIYKIQFNDFLAYFHSGDNIHLFFPPFQIFNYAAPWVGTFWLEEVIFVYLFGALGLIRLIKKKEKVLAWFVGIFFASILFVSHRDLIRYSLPIVPFLFAAFADTITKKEFKIAMAILAIPIYLFSLAYISQNVMPISDWAPLL